MSGQLWWMDADAWDRLEAAVMRQRIDGLTARQYRASKRADNRARRAARKVQRANPRA